jgi:hypothetical protein
MSSDDGMRLVNNNYGDSPVVRGSVPIPSTLFDSCLRTPALAAIEAACILNTRHSLEAPLRVEAESWPPQPSACPRPSPHAVSRVENASRERR